ncbi:HEAT repeat domain-containing protein [Plantibacter sp. LMC-P-059a]|uniref:HEAT repeat domain-containing protein n=1 Tax=Plantibacter sp. LMC-P-059a TaxID=3040297 RepID=UPI00254D90FB|nr:HEAT repeat domain-containing protein [Plantibacter sp. LMC-P-059a]
MSSEYDDAAANGLAHALRVPASSDRLQAALAAGTTPKPAYIEVLVDRCAVEPDFFVRDMLTWALVRHDPEVTVPRLIEELGSVFPQARSQALHTLSKTGDPRTWSAITLALLEDDEDQVARAAWRTAAGVVPEREAPALAELLARQFGRGDRDVRLSLTRAFLSIGELAVDAVEQVADAEQSEREARVHARATARMLRDPELDFDEAVQEAQHAFRQGR